ASGSEDYAVEVWESVPSSADTLRKRALVEKVDWLFGRLVLKDLVLREVRIDPTLNKMDRQFALQVARTRSEPHPGSLAFQARAQHQLGQKDEAKTTLGRLREVMKQERWANDAEAQASLHEAEELIEGKSANKER